MAIRERLSGNEAVAHAIKQINPDVMPAFPITPSTEIPQFVSTFISNGEIDTEFIPVESEHMPLATWRCQGSRQFRSVHIKGNSKRKQDEHCDIRKHHAHHDKKTRTRRTSTHDSSSSSDVDRSAGRRHRSMH